MIGKHAQWRRRWCLGHCLKHKCGLLVYFYREGKIPSGLTPTVRCSLDDQVWVACVSPDNLDAVTADFIPLHGVHDTPEILQHLIEEAMAHWKQRAR